jgi:hypothetical protein
MKNIFLIAVLVGGFYYFTNEKTVSVEYYYDGPYPNEIQRGLDYWGSNRMQFSRVNNPRNAFLFIQHVDPEYIKNKNWVAQYVPRTKTIMLNNHYERYLKGSYLSATVAHESGHFIGLKHNDEVNSIMNAKLEYNKTAPSFLDKQRANDRITVLYYKKKFNNFINENDDYSYIGSSYK